MSDVKKNPEYLLLLPMPLSPGQVQKKAAFLKKKLEVKTRREIIEDELRMICNWKKITHLPTRRLYRNYTLIYSPKELGKQISLMISTILNEPA